MKPNPLTKEERIEVRKFVENEFALQYYFENDFSSAHQKLYEMAEAIGRVIKIGISNPNYEFIHRITDALEDYASKDSFKNFLDKLDDIKRDYQIKKLTE